MTLITEFSFTKSQRLLTPKDYQAVASYKVGKTTRSHFFKIHQDNLLCFIKYYPEQSQDNVAMSRLGLAITKKKVKRAHERNRIKRLTREYFRLQHHKLSGQVDMVLTIKQFSNDLANEEIVRQLANIFDLINVKISQQSKRQ